MSTLQLQMAHQDKNGFALELDTEIPLQGVTAIFGPSGSGKTTLLDCIAGLRPDVTAAVVNCDGSIWQDAGRFLAPWKRTIGYVFQDARLLPHLSVEGNLRYAEQRAPTGGIESSQVIQWLNLDELLSRLPEELSAGQSQRVAIARALLRNPELLLLDEPLANLDHAAADECLTYLQRVGHQSELPMLYVSHRIEEVSRIADRLLLMDNGKLQAQGPIAEMLSRLDTRLIEDEAAAALLKVEIGDFDDRYQLTELKIGNASVWVSGDSSGSGAHRLRVAARDVSVCRERPGHSSILNVLPVVLKDIHDVSSAHCMLQLALEDQTLLARITRRSRDELSLAVGDALYAQIKSTALFRDGHS